MNAKHHLLVIDPTAYAGGSKVATENILKLTNSKKLRITVLTADKNSWKWPELKYIKLFQFKWLAKQDQGIAFFLRHIFIAMNILMLRLRCGKIDIALGVSGPGVDLALYLIKPVLGFNIVQLIHGPVATSRIIGRCLHVADEVHYLESTKGSLLSALSRTNSVETDTPQTRILDNFNVMQNGLPKHNWPSRCQHHRPVIFWAASLLKWKGLETLIDALQSMASEARPETHICYIRPEETSLPISQAPLKIKAVHWHENPQHLNEIRAEANIFVSTSNNEPFGLSILEAMAAGQCILIPADGAYWDHILENGINCIKYTPGDADDLAKKLYDLSVDMNRVISLGESACKLAFNYRAETQYTNIKNSLEQGSSITDLEKSLHTNLKVTQ